MPAMTAKNIAIAAAGAALAGHVSAFNAFPSTAVRQVAAPMHLGSICSTSSRRDVLALRASSTETEVSQEQSTNGVQKAPPASFAIEIDTDSMLIDPAGFSAIDVKGDYVEDGWVEESAGPGLFGGMFGNMFGGGEKKVANGMTQSELEKEMDVIEFLDGSKGSLTEAVRTGTAVPFGGLNPNQIETFQEQQALKREAYNERIAAAGPLPAGWFSAMDEESGAEYFYNAAGDVTWERPSA